MLTRDDLLALNRAELTQLLHSGHPIAAGELDDWEYRGISLGLPAFIERLSWKKFKKVFKRTPDGLRGWNVRLEQNGLDEPCVPMLEGGKPITFGHYRVVDPVDVPTGCDRGLLIDYGQGDNGRMNPISRLRDPIVAVNSGSTDLLLGWSYVDLGIKTVGTPSFFSLERDAPLS